MHLVNKSRTLSSVLVYMRLLVFFVFTAIPPPGLDQTPMNPLNPFLTPGPALPSFGFSPFGKWSQIKRISALNGV